MIQLIPYLVCILNGLAIIRLSRRITALEQIAELDPSNHERLD